MLKNNSPAKDFKTKDLLGNEIQLEKFKGKKIMLSFYRYAGCPLCNLRINQLINQYDNFKTKNMELIAIFQSPKSSMKKYISSRHDIPFPVISDPKRRLYKIYEVESSLCGLLKGMTRLKDFGKALTKGLSPGKMEGDIGMIPADFLINEKGIIDVAYYGKDIGDHLPLTEIQDWLSTN